MLQNTGSMSFQKWPVFCDGSKSCVCNFWFQKNNLESFHENKTLYEKKKKHSEVSRFFNYFIIVYFFFSHKKWPFLGEYYKTGKNKGQFFLQTYKQKKINCFFVQCWSIGWGHIIKLCFGFIILGSELRIMPFGSGSHHTGKSFKTCSNLVINFWCTCLNCFWMISLE